MKLRIRMVDGSVTMKVEVAPPHDVGALQRVVCEALARSLDPSLGRLAPVALSFSLNRKEYFSGPPSVPLSSLGVCSGDLLHVSVVASSPEACFSGGLHHVSPTAGTAAVAVDSNARSDLLPVSLTPTESVTILKQSPLDAFAAHREAIHSMLIDSGFILLSAAPSASSPACQETSSRSLYALSPSALHNYQTDQGPIHSHNQAPVPTIQLQVTSLGNAALVAYASCECCLARVQDVAIEALKTETSLPPPFTCQPQLGTGHVVAKPARGSPSLANSERDAGKFSCRPCARITPTNFRLVLPPAHSVVAPPSRPDARPLRAEVMDSLVIPLMHHLYACAGLGPAPIAGLLSLPKDVLLRSLLPRLSPASLVSLSCSCRDLCHLVEGPEAEGVWERLYTTMIPLRDRAGWQTPSSARCVDAVAVEGLGAAGHLHEGERGPGSGRGDAIQRQIRRGQGDMVVLPFRHPENGEVSASGSSVRARPGQGIAACAGMDCGGITWSRGLWKACFAAAWQRVKEREKRDREAVEREREQQRGWRWQWTQRGPRWPHFGGMIGGDYDHSPGGLGGGFGAWSGGMIF